MSRRSEYLVTYRNQGSKDIGRLLTEHTGPVTSVTLQTWERDIQERYRRADVCPFVLSFQRLDGSLPGAAPAADRYREALQQILLLNGPRINEAPGIARRALNYPEGT